MTWRVGRRSGSRAHAGVRRTSKAFVTRRSSAGPFVSRHRPPKPKVRHARHLSKAHSLQHLLLKRSKPIKRTKVPPLSKALTPPPGASIKRKTTSIKGPKLKFVGRSHLRRPTPLRIKRLRMRNPKAVRRVKVKVRKARAIKPRGINF